MAVPPLTGLTLHDNLVTFETKNATIRQIALALGKKAGFKVHLSGDLGDPVRLSVKDMPVARFLQKMVGSHSLIMIDAPTDSETVRNIAMIYIVANPNARIAPQDIVRAAPTDKPEDSASLEARRLLEDSIGGREWATPDQRVAAIESLSLSKDKGAVETLENVIARETDTAIRDDAVNALANMGGQDATLALARILFGHADPQARRLAIRGLATLEGNVPRDFITHALKDRSASVRKEAASALAR